MDVLVSSDNGKNWTKSTVAVDSDIYNTFQHTNSTEVDGVLYRRVGAQETR